MAEHYYRLERKKKKKNNTRFFLLAGIAVVVSISVIAAAAVMNSTFGDGSSGLTMNHSKTSSQTSSVTGGGTVSSKTSAAASSKAESSKASSNAQTGASSKPAAPSAASSNVTVSTSSEKTESALPVQNTMKDGFDFTKPVAESKAVSRSYFDDAVIIGDSRAVGMIQQTGLSNAKSYAKVSCTAKVVLEKADITNSAGQKVTILQDIQASKDKYKKVYIMLGLNEIGYQNYGVLMQSYKKIIDGIQESQPNAVIYLQTVLPITKAAHQTHSYLRVEKVKQFNTQLMKLAQQEKVYYIDPSAVFLGNDGFMLDEAAASKADKGIHFNKTYNQKWLDYLMTHTVQ